MVSKQRSVTVQTTTDLTNTSRNSFLGKLPKSSKADGLDSAGRVKVPKLLKDHAGLDGNCIVIGAGDYLEIWNGDAWQKKSEELDREAATIAEGISRSSE